MRIRRTIAVVGAVSALAWAALGAPAAGAHPGISRADGGSRAPQRASAGCSWKTVAVTKAGGFARLHGMSATAGNDVWAVGSKDAFGTPLTLHFNGAHWTEVTAPTKGAGVVDLNDIEAISKTNAWAVGYFSDSHGHDRTLVEHWDGHVWKIVTSPNDGAQDNQLKGVSAVSPTNVWAVGFTGPDPGEGMLIEHWNGQTWTLSTPGLVQAPGPGILDDVSAISASNVVAVGHRSITAAHTLVERFNGTHWTAEASADPSTVGNELWGVSAPSAGAQWAVGDITNSQANARTLAERSTGGAWTSKPPGNVGTPPNQLFDVSGLSATRAFAVGMHKTAGGVRRTLAESFANGSWKVLATPNAGTRDNLLEAVAAVSATNVWAAGTASTLVGTNPLVLHFTC
jgi:hypothetical protein